ncbi:hypothetical protein [Paracoccus sp. (in: a-proteobacteria)]|uniref:hypothetical protein n=1 Tax=Paracoccus sp. TaxID=267 RepID=UPI00289B19C5|nr:hypothetical protein [Paracoccus sp. (in: a-proteobacteria)]
MRQSPSALKKLGKLAKVKSDLEMRRFSAFRLQVEAARARIADLEARLQQLYRPAEVFSVAQARLTNALTIELVRSISAEKASLEQMLPRFEVARQHAMREFGRVQVIDELRRDQIAQLAEQQERKTR